MRQHHSIRLEGRTYKLRLTLRGQRRLKDRFDEDSLETIFLAAADSQRMSALLTESLNWPESGNEILDGEALYDLLVDGGFQGQEQFGGLALDIAAASGLMTAAQAARVKATLHDALEQAFSGLGGERGNEEGEETTPFPQG